MDDVTRAKLIANKIAEISGLEITSAPGYTVKAGEYYLIPEGEQKLIAGELYSEGETYVEGEIYVI